MTARSFRLVSFSSEVLCLETDSCRCCTVSQSPEQARSAAGSLYDTPVPEEMDFDLFGPSPGSPTAGFSSPPVAQSATAAQVPVSANWGLQGMTSIFFVFNPARASSCGFLLLVGW